MKHSVKRILLLVVLLGSLGIAKSQEYLYEIGPTAGASFYSGDANNFALFQEPKSVYGISIRRNFNLRTALKLDLLNAEVSGDTRKTSNALPIPGYLVFNTKFHDINAHLEYSFFSYSDTFKYKETRKFTPYIFTGLGFTWVSKPFFLRTPPYGNPRFPYGTMVNDPTRMSCLNIPLGLGVKYKIAHRYNIGLEYSLNMLFSDKIERIDVLDDAYHAESNALLKNKDWHSYLKCYITVDIIQRRCKCNKLK